MKRFNYEKNEDCMEEDDFSIVKKSVFSLIPLLKVNILIPALEGNYYVSEKRKDNILSFQ